MCFRPAAVGSSTVECPECGAENKFGAKVCEKCGAKIPVGPAKSAPGAPGGPKAPGAPGAPGAPKAPGAPGAPGRPKAPGAPKR